MGISLLFMLRLILVTNCTPSLGFRVCREACSAQGSIDGVLEDEVETGVYLRFGGGFLKRRNAQNGLRERDLECFEQFLYLLFWQISLKEKVRLSLNFNGFKAGEYGLYL